MPHHAHIAAHHGQFQRAFLRNEGVGFLRVSRNLYRWSVEEGLARCLAHRAASHQHNQRNNPERCNNRFRHAPLPKAPSSCRSPGNSPVGSLQASIPLAIRLSKNAHLRSMDMIERTGFQVVFGRRFSDCVSRYSRSSLALSRTCPENPGFSQTAQNPINQPVPLFAADILVFEMSSDGRTVCAFRRTVHKLSSATAP